MVFERKTKEIETIQEPKELYCQTCNRNLTGPKELVIAQSQGSVYCAGYEGRESGSGGRCVDKDLEGTTIATYIDRHSINNWPEGAQEVIDLAIEKGVLVNFGHLERETVSDKPF